MKRIVLVIFFLGIIVWGWNTIREELTPGKAVEKTEQTPVSEASQNVDRIISVLVEANSFAEIGVVPVNSLPSNLVRRYRPAGFSFDHLFVCAKTGQHRIFNLTLKTFLEFSHVYAARLKTMGYYIYTLRKIII